ncbi:prenyltransferase/squalene oxidase repeat-containing protein [Gemmatimonadota bacterium]
MNGKPGWKRIIVTMLATCLLLSCGGESGTADRRITPTGSPIHPTAAWVLACRVGETGFGCFPGDSAFTSRTGMALEVLDRLGVLEGLSGRQELVAWLKARQQGDGGFLEAGNYYHGKELPWGTKSALEPTYWALRALELLDSSPDNPAAVMEFVNARRGTDGGYDAYEYAFGAAQEALYTTFWAVGALKILGVPVSDSAATLVWVRGMQDTMGERGGFALSDDDWRYASVAGCYYAMRIFELLGYGPARPDKAREFLLSEYGQEPDGGFEVGHNRGWRQNHYSRTEDTYYAVRSLALLGTPLSDLDFSRAKRPRSDCAAWIASRQNRDGGFGRFGISEHTLLASPSEMRSTWHAVLALGQLGAAISAPTNAVTPVNEVAVHAPEFRHPCVNSDDPVEVWAYRRIALPVYEHFLEVSGSKLEALGRLNRWASAAIGPHNGAWITQGRGILMHGWGQCGTMSWLMQELVTSVDYAARASFIIADVNLEILVQEDGWTEPHWCLFVPFTHEFPNPAISPPDGRDNGWSVLDMAIDYRLRKIDPSRPRPTRIADRLFADVRLEMIDPVTGKWGKGLPLDSTATYESPVADSLYPGGSW